MSKFPALLLCCWAASALPHVGYTAECECATATARSLSDGGQCVVDESSSGYCVIEWRGTSQPTAADSGVRQKAEAGAQTFMTAALSTGQGPLGQAEAWEVLKNYAAETSEEYLYKGASAYLERTHPKEYSADLALTSFAALLGSSSANADGSVRTGVAEYFQLRGPELFARLSGQANPEPTVEKLSTGRMIADHSTFGCLELRQLQENVSDPSGPFDFLLGVRTSFAEDAQCLRR